MKNPPDILSLKKKCCKVSTKSGRAYNYICTSYVWVWKICQNINDSE